MRAELSWAVMLGLLVGCASSTPAASVPESYWRTGDHVHVRGPWAAVTPSSNVDEVIDQLCPAIMKLPRSQDGEYGQEYCGAIYSLGDGTYYASMPSPLGEPVLVGPAKQKKCIPPRYVADERGRPAVLGDFHSHPWSPSQMSAGDRIAATQLWSIRIQFDRACTVMKLIPYVENDERPGEFYLRKEKSWKLVGIIRPEDKRYGLVTAVGDE
ncbi:hypothetical protein [Pyxidicoccus caerfyrddinensis]|uniref:hypothetical protein n=1 Tax=Pyxidicoccus caerfyrddinensis TaxID=2709663 RepID=UPI0013DBD837|nr:hypothetical protein [Pyxidicoccus caerfyrddinensis]